MPGPEDRRASLRARGDDWCERLKAAPRIVRVQRMTRTWGSCATVGIVTLAENLADQEKCLQDVVIAQELLHLRVPTHGKGFQARMTAYVPRWRDHDKHRLAGHRSGVSR